MRLLLIDPLSSHVDIRHLKIWDGIRSLSSEVKVLRLRQVTGCLLSTFEMNYLIKGLDIVN